MKISVDYGHFGEICHVRAYDGAGNCVMIFDLARNERQAFAEKLIEAAEEISRDAVAQMIEGYRVGP